MTEQLKNAGASLAAYWEKHAPAFVSLIFAFGFVWAQFDGVRTQLSETRSTLQRLSDVYGKDSLRIAADRRDTERLLAEVAFLRERIAAQRVNLQAIAARISKVEAVTDAK